MGGFYDFRGLRVFLDLFGGSLEMPASRARLRVLRVFLKMRSSLLEYLEGFKGFLKKGGILLEQCDGSKGFLFYFLNTPRIL